MNQRAYTTDYPVQHDSMGLSEYWYAIRSRWWLVAGITLLVVLVTLAITFFMTPQYRATSTLQIERDAMNVVNVENLIPSESPMDRDFYQTQYELLQSRTLAREVIREAKLGSHPQFKEVADAAAAKAEGQSERVKQDMIERALTGQVLEGLEVEPVRNSRLVRIHFQSPDPELAAKVANTYARLFIANNLSRRLDASTFAVKYLSERLAQLKSRVEESEKELVGYSADQQIVSIGDNQPSLAAQNLSELNGMLAAAQDAKIKAEAAWQQARNASGLGIPQVSSNPVVQSLRQTKATLSAEYQQKLSTYKPDYPEMMRLKSQISELDRQINAEVANVRQSIKAEYDAATMQENMLVSRIAGLKGDELDLQNRSIRYNMLKREVDTNRQLYDALLQRFKEIGVAGNVGANNISVIDSADVPTQAYSPRVALFLAVGLIFGVFLGLVAALIAYFLGSAPRGLRDR